MSFVLYSCVSIVGGCRCDKGGGSSQGAGAGEAVSDVKFLRRWFISLSIYIYQVDNGIVFSKPHPMQ